MDIDTFTHATIVSLLALFALGFVYLEDRSVECKKRLLRRLSRERWDRFDRVVELGGADVFVTWWTLRKLLASEEVEKQPDEELCRLRWAIFTSTFYLGFGVRLWTEFDVYRYRLLDEWRPRSGRAVRTPPHAEQPHLELV